MTTLMQQIKTDQLKARKNREADKAALLTTLIGEASIIGKNNNRETTNEEVISVIKKFTKGINETIALVSGCMLERMKLEKDILEVYLPQQMGEEELFYAIVGSPKNKGEIMQYLKFNYAGRYDGKLASKVVDEYIKLEDTTSRSFKV